MITVTNYPAENRVLLDGNQTQIQVTSTNGSGYYFRAKIYINDELFDEQGWSRKDDYTAIKDLIYLYHAYFKPYFLGVFDAGLLEQADFKKKVTIEIEERLIATDEIVQSLTLPDFYIIYNVKSEDFNDADKITVLGLTPNRFRISKSGTVSIPFFVNADDETVSVVIKDDNDNILHQQSIENVSGKKMYIYNLSLSEVTLLSSALYLTADVSCGSTTIQKIYSIIKLPSYEVKELVFQNNYGFYIPAYFDGDFEDKRGFSSQKYEQFNNSEKVFAVDEEGTYVINTGKLNVEEKEIVREVANSLDCYFKNGTRYSQVVTGIKKATYNKSRENIYGEDLTFTFRAGLPFTNDLTLPDITPEIILSTITTSDYVNFETTFTTNFPMLQLFSQIRFGDGYAWEAPVELAGLTSPQNRVVSLGGSNFQIRFFSSYNGETVYSNILDYVNLSTSVVTMPSSSLFTFSKTSTEILSETTASENLTETLLFDSYSNSESLPYTKIRVLTVPATGTLTIDGVDVVAPEEILLADIQSGKFKFWPTGSDNSYPYESYLTTFSYVVIDSSGNESDPTTMTIIFGAY